MYFLAVAYREHRKSTERAQTEHRKSTERAHWLEMRYACRLIQTCSTFFLCPIAFVEGATKLPTCCVKAFVLLWCRTWSRLRLAAFCGIQPWAGLCRIVFTPFQPCPLKLSCSPSPGVLPHCPTPGAMDTPLIFLFFGMLDCATGISRASGMVM